MSVGPLPGAASARPGWAWTVARRTGVLSGVLTAAGVLAVLVAPPALAHDRLERIDPATGSQLPTAPGQIRLVFDQAVGRRFSTVVVTGPDGAAWAAGPPQVLDSTVTQVLRPGGPAGIYAVAYRIVSADGHPVTGTSSFTVTTTGSSSGPGAVGAPSAGASAQPPTAGASASPPAAAGHAAAHVHSSGRDFVAPLLGGLAVVAVLAGAVRAAERRRRGLPISASSSGDRS